MTTTYHPSVHRFAIFVVCWTILLLVAGALVTSNEAALSVPDWPLSYGTLTPPMVGGIVYEHSHRVIAGSPGPAFHRIGCLGVGSKMSGAGCDGSA